MPTKKDIEIENKQKEVARLIGQSIRAIRLSKKITKRKIADLTGFDENNYGRFEDGLGNPTVKSLVKICIALDIELQDIIPIINPEK